MANSARLVIIGDGAMRDAAVEKLRQLRLDHMIWMPGVRDDVEGILRSLDVFVLPSLAEGISNTILEAMATGLPVVATDVGGNAELVEDGRTGILVPPADAESLASAMRRYVQDPLLRRLHGEAGAARVRRMFSMQAMIDRYLNVYRSVAACDSIL